MSMINKIKKSESKPASKQIYAVLEPIVSYDTSHEVTFFTSKIAAEAYFKKSNHDEVILCKVLKKKTCKMQVSETIEEFE